MGFMANPQSWEKRELGALLGSNPFMSPFYTALKQAENVVAVRNKRGNLYSRLWCVFELLAAKQSAKPIIPVGKNPRNIDPENVGFAASCSDEKDTLMLRIAIQVHGKEEEVNAYLGEVIFARPSQWDNIR